MKMLLSCGLAAAAAAPLAAQQPEAAGPDLVSVANQSFGMDVVDGALRAGGPRYKAVFDRDGVEYTPALGLDAPINYPVRFTVTSIRRGEVAAYDAESAGMVTPRHDGMIASYQRGRDIVETYEARVSGLKQNFTFANKPLGTGDLVVEGRLSTALMAAQLGANDAGLQLQMSGLGGVQIGAVVGVDANGQRRNGGLSFDGSLVRFVLPAAFVEEAAYPMVLDPFISTIANVNTTSAADPDVAFDETYDDFLLVWEHLFSQADIDVRGQKVDLAGNLVQSAILITNESGNEINPAVANVDAGSDYFVAYQDASSVFGPWDIRGRRVDGGSVTSMSATIDVAATAANETTPDVSGDNSAIGGVNDGVIVVFDDSTGISAVKVDVSSTAIVAGPTPLSTSADDSLPCISKSGGVDGRHMVAWQRDYGTDHDLIAALVDRNLVVLDGVTGFAGGIPDDEVHADVDGDGNVFMAVFQVHEAGLSGPSDVYCRRLEWNGTSLVTTGPAELVEGTPGLDERDPAIGNLGSKYVAAWSAQALVANLDYDIVAMELNPDTCLACGVRQVSQGGAGNLIDIAPAIATRYSGRASNDPTTADQGMIVWMDGDQNPPFSSNVVGNLYEAFGGGVVTDLGGACGAGGTNAINGPVALGNSELNLTVSGAGSNLLLVSIMFANSAVSCGACAINSDTGSFLSTVGSGGSSSFALPIPCDSIFLGTQFYTQWAAVLSGGNACAIVPSSLQIGFSNRMTATIGT